MMVKSRYYSMYYCLFSPNFVKIRIEDDVIVTASTVEEIEAWIEELEKTWT